MAITILIGIIVLSVLILTHELGHFVTAKLSGVKVEEFGLGFPPRYASFTYGETRYSLNVIPFGGFTKMSGEEDPTKPRSLAGKSRKARLLVLSAGSLMNLLLALILFSVGYLFPRDAASGQVLIEQVAQNSPAMAAGIKAGEIVLDINNQPVTSGSDLSKYVQASLGTNTTLLLQLPDSTKVTVSLIPRANPPPGEGSIGIATRTVKLYPAWQALPRGARELADAFVGWGSGLISVFSHKVSASFIGPVGLVQLTGQAAGFGIVSLLQISAFISLILGVMNLLPLPAVDGGRIAFVVLEWARRGKRVSPKTEGIVHLVGFGLFLLLFLAITYQDIARIISGGSPIP